MYSIDIKTKEKITDVSASLYGLFFEDINRSGDGGLYAELIRNRAFDEGIIPEGCTYDAQNKMITSPTGWVSSFDCCESEGIAAWECKNGANMELTDKNTLHQNRKRALKVHFNGGMILNDGFRGVPVEEGKKYRFYMFAKSEKNVDVTVMLCSADGKSYGEQVFCVSGEYGKYECELTSSATDYNARLGISSGSKETVILGFTSLFPKDTYMERENGLRKSLVEKLLRLNPSFLRFPGGCIVEGFSKETAYRFEDSIGPVWERKPHWLLWAYMTTNGLGYHEYLQFCEDAGIDAMYVFNCGMTCQGRNPDFFDEKLVEEFYEDAVHAILYATASTENEWGKRRAENGHPEPFKVLKYLEIGNENWGEEYNKRYQYFYERLKKEFPQFIYISTDHTEKTGLTTECVDEHFYADPVFFATNTKMYDNLDRRGCDIYCGEYAATIGCKEGILYGALGEAAFLTGIERNQDKVKMTSYAPLFQNVAYMAWEPDMIVFNNHEDYAIPSYYMLEMFGNNRGDYVCGYNVETGYDKRCETGAFRISNMDKTMFSNIKINGKICDTLEFLIGKTDENSQRFSADLECENGEIHICFWDTGFNGEDQNHYDWIVKNQKSKVVHYNGWSNELICECIDCDVICGKNSVEIETFETGFEIVLNGKVLHKETLALVPHITAVCTVDKKEETVITKLVNFSENEIDVSVCCDVNMQDSVELTTLTGNSYYSKNSFENKYSVYPYTEKIAASKNYTIHVKPRSVNVVKHKFMQK
ncbi:MAG: hypothetical protein IJ282_08360 [Lachnospiraceae bacterium]|nr:hypothetical protein [Lachnospiraceae bacterium]